MQDAGTTFRSTTESAASLPSAQPTANKQNSKIPGLTTANTTTSPPIKKKGESHRIYWQQWIVSGPDGSSSVAANQSSQQQGQHRVKRQLITSSAAVRISTTGEARAKDVTDLLRDTLQLSSSAASANSSISSSSSNGDVSASINGTGVIGNEDQDALVLVGTLYSLPGDYVDFENELVQRHQQQQSANMAISFISADGNCVSPNRYGSNSNDSNNKMVVMRNSTTRSNPFHTVRTLKPHENPLQVRDLMAEHLKRLEKEWISTSATSTATALATATTSSSATSGNESINPNRTVISPKMQWFFVPGTSSHGANSGNISNSCFSIPNCIDLDGYCTSMEEEHDDDDDDYWYEEAGESGMRKKTGAMITSLDPVKDEMSARFPWLTGDNEYETDDEDENDEDRCHPSDACFRGDGSSSLFAQEQRRQQQQHENFCPEFDEREQRKYFREELRYYELLQSQSATRPYQLMSGYLLKRSRQDPQVWRKVHCVLTYDHLWFVSRLHNMSSNKRTIHGTSSNCNFCRCTGVRRYAKHGRIKLTRALLLQPSADYAPLFRTPYSFEVVSASGTSHIFRAPHKKLQVRWIQAISELIVESYENSLLQYAELLTADQCSASSRRMSAIAAEPLWEAFADRCQMLQDDSSESIAAGEKPSPMTQTEPTCSRHLGSILRWGIEVAEYRECVRYIQSRLPAKSLVVVTTQPKRQVSNSSLHEIEHGGNVHSMQPISPEPIDPATQHMIRATWEQAKALLARATHVALQVQAKLSRSVETSCRHVDYVLTGRFRSFSDGEFAATSGSGAASASLSSPAATASSLNGAIQDFNKNSPPPIDLFDHLLSELQNLAANAAATEAQEEISTENTGVSTGG